MAQRLVDSARSRYLRWTWPLAIALLLLAGSSGCAGESQQALPPATQTPSPASSPVPTLPVQTAGREVRSDRQRNASPRASARDLKALVQGNNTFALNLYGALSDGEGNLFFSPFSISQALAMTLAGARGETERQMTNTLHYELPQSALHSSFNALDRDLASRGQGLQVEENQFFELNIANAIWGQQGYEFLPDFLDVLAENYGAGLRPLDFSGAPEESRARINDWVSEETQDKIRDPLPFGAVDSNTRLVLTNAIYFNASWQWPFDKQLTRELLSIWQAAVWWRCR